MKKLVLFLILFATSSNFFSNDVGFDQKNVFQKNMMQVKSFCDSRWIRDRGYVASAYLGSWSLATGINYQILKRLQTRPNFNRLKTATIFACLPVFVADLSFLAMDQVGDLIDAKYPTTKA